MKRFDPRWQLRRCVNCGHEERFPALCPLEALCSACHGRTWRADGEPGGGEESVGGGRTMHIILCLCGCGTVLSDLRRRDTLYAGRSHSTRAWKARVAYDVRRASERARKASPTGDVYRLSDAARRELQGVDLTLVQEYGTSAVVKRAGTDDTFLVKRADLVRA